MNKTSELQQFIENVIREKMNMDVPQEIDLQAGVEQAYGLDSIAMFELIVNLEDRFSLKVPDEDLAEFGLKTLAELEGYLEGFQPR